MGKISKMYFNGGGGGLAVNMQMDRRLMFMKKFGRGNENYINNQNQGHMTKMATMAKNSKTIEKSSSPEPESL